MGNRLTFKTRFFFRATSALTLFCFILTSSVWADGQISTAIQIPEQIGHISQRWQPLERLQRNTFSKKEISSNLPYVVLIRDAHQSFEAQKNLAEIAKYLNRFYGVRTLAVEGAYQKIELDALRRYPLRDITQKTSENFVKEGKFTGSEWAALTAEQPMQLVGVEDRALFEKNFKQFYQIHRNGKHFREALTAIEEELKALAARYYSPQMQQLIQRTTKVKAEGQEWPLFLHEVVQLSQKQGIDLESNFPNLTQWVEWAFGQGEFEDNRQKIENALEDIGKKLKPKLVQKFEKYQQQYHNKVISEREFVATAVALAHTQKTHIKVPALLTQYQAHLSRGAMVDYEAVFSELDVLILQLLQRMAPDRNAQQALKLTQELELLKAVVGLQAKPAQVQAFRDLKKQQWTWTTFVSEFQELQFRTSAILERSIAKEANQLIQKALDFYEIAEQRNEALVQNLLETIQSSERPDAGQTAQSFHAPVGLVAGGYHTEGLAQELRERSVPYIIVTPTISSTAADVPYLDRMLGRLMPLAPHLTSTFTALLAAVVESEVLVREDFQAHRDAEFALQGLIHGDVAAVEQVRQSQWVDPDMFLKIQQAADELAAEPEFQVALKKQDETSVREQLQKTIGKKQDLDRFVDRAVTFLLSRALGAAEARITANAAKGKGAPDLESHRRANDAIKTASNDPAGPRGKMAQQGETGQRRVEWPLAGEETQAKVQRVLERIEELIRQERLPYTVNLFERVANMDPDRASEVVNIDEIPVIHFLRKTNIILIDPPIEDQPGLYRDGPENYQVSHIGAGRNAIYLDSVVFESLATDEDIDLAAVWLFHDGLELRAKQVVETWGADKWVVPIASLIHDVAEQIEVELVGPSDNGHVSRLDDKLQQILFETKAPGTKPITEVFSQDKLDVMHVNEGGSEIPLREKFAELARQYNEAVEQIARAAIDPSTGQVTDNTKIKRVNIARGEKLIQEVIQEYYNIGLSALFPDKAAKQGLPAQVYAKNYIVALQAFNQVKRIRPLTEQMYSEAVQGLPYRPARDAMPRFSREISEEAKQVDLLWDAAYDRYLSLVSLGEAAIDNIRYDLRISDEQLFHGESHNGRSFEQLYEMALALRAMLFEKDETQVSRMMKVRAAYFLSELFSAGFHNGIAAREIDEKGGLSVPVEVRDLLKGSSLEEFETAEQMAFTTFAWKGNAFSLSGHSLTSLDWLAQIYQAIAKQYYAKSVRDALILESMRVRPELARMMQELSEKGSLDEMLGYYQKNFPKLREKFRDGTVGGVVLEVPVRVELTAGAIGDFAGNSLDQPYLYMIDNASAVLTRESGAVGRNIQIGAAVRPLEEMRNTRDERGPPVFVEVDSLDMGWHEEVKQASDLTRKRNATLVLDALTTLGLFPKEMLERAKRDNKQTEVLKSILSHLIGPDQGLSIDLHVENIAPGSGLAVSNLIAVGVALAIGRMMEPVDKPVAVAPSQGKALPESETEEMIQLTLSVEQPETQPGEEGFYDVQICNTPACISGEWARIYPTQNVDGQVILEIPRTDLNGEGNYYVRTRYVTAQQVRENVADTNHWTETIAFTVQGTDVTAGQQNSLKISSSTRAWQYVDSMSDVIPAIVNSQWVQWFLGVFSGTQDDVAAVQGGIRWLRSGEPLEGTIREKTNGDITERYVRFNGSIVPTMTNVPLSDEILEQINQGVNVFRIGLTADSNVTLTQVYTTHVLNAQVDATNAWGQITIETLKALVAGDIRQLGRLAMAAVPLREKIAPVSINPIIIGALEKMVDKWGADRFSYGISGARSEGSVLIYVKPEHAQEIMAELQEELGHAILDRGKLMPQEDDPRPYSGSIVRRGARIRVLTPEEMRQRRQREIQPMAIKQRAVHDRMKVDHALYKPEEAQSALDQSHVNEEVLKTLLKDKGILILDPDLVELVMERLEWPDVIRVLDKIIAGEKDQRIQALYPVIQRSVGVRGDALKAIVEHIRTVKQDSHIADNDTLFSGVTSPHISLIDLSLVGELEPDAISKILEQKENLGLSGRVALPRKSVEKLAEHVLYSKYEKFRSSANNKAREMIRKRLSANMQHFLSLREKGIYTTEKEHAWLTLVLSTGKENQGTPSIDLTMPFTETELEQIIQSLGSSSEKRVIDAIAKRHHATQEGFWRDIERSDLEYTHSERDGDQFQNAEFWNLLEEEKAKLKIRIEKARQQLQIASPGHPASESARRTLMISEMILDAIELAPNPEYLPWDHFLFRFSETYQRTIGHKMALLPKAMQQGALLYYLPAGGAGTRYGKGNVVKQVVPLHYGNEPDAKYLEMNLRKWSRYYRRFPEHRMGIVQILTSTFTDNAIRAVLDHMMSEADLQPEQIATVQQSLNPVVRPTEMELQLHEALQGAATPELRRQLALTYERYRRNAVSHLTKEREKLRNSARVAEADELQRTPFDRVGLNPLNAYAPSGTAGMLEGLLVESDDTYTVTQLEALGYKLNPDLVALVPEAERINGMPAAKAALIIDREASKNAGDKSKDLGLSVVMIQQSSSRAPIVDAHVADAVYDITQNDRMAIVHYANVAGGRDVGGVLVREKSTGTIMSLEGNRMQFVDRVILDDDHTAIATGTVFLNARRLYELLEYADPKEFLKTSMEQRQKQMAHMMNEKWSHIVQLKMRTEEEVGHSWDWPILQHEVVLAMVMGDIQKDPRFGRDAVRFMEVSSPQAYIDDKAPEQFQAGLKREQSFRSGAGLHTALPSDQISDLELAYNGWKRWVSYYEQHRLWKEAQEAVKRIEKIIKKAEDLGVQINESSFSELRTDVRQIKDTLGRSKRSEGADVSDIAGADIGRLQSRLLKLTRYRKKPEYDVYSENVGADEIERRISEFAKNARQARYARGLQGKKLEAEKGAAIPKLARIRELQEEIRTLAFMESEFIGFFNLGVEALNEKKGDADAQKQFRVFPHKITILTDKDATLEDPSRALLQSPRETEADQYSPDHAEQLIRQAHRGATIYILTGSSALEAWRDIYVPVLAVIGRMGLSRFEQRIALERIVVLANDGASVLSVNTDQEPFESSIAHNDLYSKSGWSPLATLYRRHPTRGTEDAAYRAISWNVSVQSFLKQLFSEQRLQNLMSWPTDEEERRRKKTSLDAFIDQLELKTTDLPDMSRMNSVDELYNVMESIAWAIEKALPHAPDGEWKTYFQNLLRRQEQVEKKIGGADKSELTPEEEVLAALLLIHYKESHWVFGSVTGDHMDRITHKGDKRFSQLAQLVQTRTFWMNTVERIKQTPQLQTLSAKVPYAIRAGNLYLNLVFGGTSKVNFIEGMMHDGRTRNAIVVLIGDSKTDQGRTPHVSKAVVNKKVWDEVREEIPAAVKNRIVIEKIFIKLEKAEREEIKALAGRVNNVDWHLLVDQMTSNGNVAMPVSYELWQSVESQLTERDRQILQVEELEIGYEGHMNKQAAQTLTTAGRRGSWRTAVETMKESSIAVYEQRIAMKFLLAALKEMDAAERAKMMEDGLIRVESMNALLDPLGDGYVPLRLGPAAVRQILNAHLSVAEEGYVLSRAEDPLDLRDQLLWRIFNISNQEHWDGVRILPPASMKRTSQWRMAHTPEEDAHIEDLVAEELTPEASVRLAPTAEPKVDFPLSESDLNRAKQYLEEELSAGIEPRDSTLTEAPSTIAALETFAVQPDGTEKGKFIVIDWGGTNLRAFLVELDGNGGWKILNNPEESGFKWTDELKKSNGAELFGAVADAVKKVIDEDPDKTDESKYTLSLIFSFGAELKNIRSAIVTENMWNKGFGPPDVGEGEDVVVWLEKALKAKNLTNTNVAAVANDTVGVQAVWTYQNRGTKGRVDVAAADLGVIAGSGFNISMDVLGKLLNLEAGGFGDDQEILDFIRTAIDIELDAAETDPRTGIHMYEKMISGNYLGEILRCWIIKEQEKGHLFRSWGTKELIQTPKRLTSEFVSIAAADDTPQLTHIRDYLSEKEIQGSTPAERQALKMAAQRIGKRSAQLVAIMMAGAIKKIDPLVSREFNIAIDGSLYRGFPNYDAMVKDALKVLLEQGAKRVHTHVLTEDGLGTGVGGAVIGAAAARVARQAGTIADVGAKASSHAAVNALIDQLVQKRDEVIQVPGLEGYEIHVVGDSKDMAIDPETGQRAHAGGISAVGTGKEVKRLWIARGWYETHPANAIQRLHHEAFELNLWWGLTEQLIESSAVEVQGEGNTIRQWVDTHYDQVIGLQEQFHDQAQRAYPVESDHVPSVLNSFTSMTLWHPSQEVVSALHEGGRVAVIVDQAVDQNEAASRLIKEMATRLFAHPRLEIQFFYRNSGETESNVVKRAAAWTGHENRVLAIVDETQEAETYHQLSQDLRVLILNINLALANPDILVQVMISQIVAAKGNVIDVFGAQKSLHLTNTLVAQVREYRREQLTLQAA